MENWDNAVVVDSRELQRLRDEHARLQKASRKQRLLLLVLAGGCAVTGLGLYMGALRLTATERDAKECRKTAMRSNVVLAALARSHENILAATEKAPSVGTKSWGRRFTVTMYLPRDPAYGRFNTGFTSTLWKADPKSRIVAVDPKLIPYGSWVWVEGLGWYRAQDCGAAIKGFRLDLLTATQRDAMASGKQDRFVIVVPSAACPLRPELAEHRTRDLGRTPGAGDLEPAGGRLGEQAKAEERERVGLAAHQVGQARDPPHVHVQHEPHALGQRLGARAAEDGAELAHVLGEVRGGDAIREPAGAHRRQVDDHVHPSLLPPCLARRMALPRGAWPPRVATSRSAPRARTSA